MRYLSLIRHAVTDWNEQGRVQGHSDVPLSAEGRRQARALYRRFAGERGVLYTSPLSRARATAALAFPQLEAVQDARLRELHFGSFEGQTLHERLAAPAWAAWAAEPFWTPAPGGESYSALRARVVAWLEDLPEAPHIIAVTHSGTIQMLLAHALGLEVPRWRKRFYLGHTSVTGLVVDGDEIFIERVNDTQHLQASESPHPEEARLEP